MVVVRGDARELSIRMDGHAGVMHEGTDIGCVMCSTIIQTFARYVEHEQHIRADVLELEEGHAYVKPRWQDGWWPEMSAAWTLCMDGFRMLEEAYPDHVHVIVSSEE